jgi:hypothetical protein
MGMTLSPGRNYVGYSQGSLSGLMGFNAEALRSGEKPEKSNALS